MAGATVALIDTGIDPAQLPETTVLRGINLSGDGEADDTTDRNGHGTQIARTILAKAPTTRFVPVKLLVDCGYLRIESNLEVAFEWIVEHCRSETIDLVCAAFSDGSCATDDLSHRGTRLQLAIARLAGLGIRTIAPAGNGYLPREREGMAWPAILREVVSAGALAGADLHPRSQRLPHQAETGCGTTVFVEPGAPGDTSGAAACVTGHLAQGGSLPDRDPGSVDWPTLSALRAGSGSSPRPARSSS